MISCTATETMTSKLENNYWVLTMSQRSKRDFFFPEEYLRTWKIFTISGKKKMEVIKMPVQYSLHFLFSKNYMNGEKIRTKYCE